MNKEIKSAEEWKDVNGYEGLYSVSNHGAVKALSKTYFSGHYQTTKKVTQDKLMCQIINVKSKYRSVVLSKNGGVKRVYIHRLVAVAFVSNPFNKPMVNHKDGNKDNNHFSNLEWCTSKENNNHALRTGLRTLSYNIHTKNLHKIKKYG